ncbi:unnamed protein product, partial [Meganyctiphanes norvegica]
MDYWQKVLLWEDDHFYRNSQFLPLNVIFTEPNPVANHGAPSLGTQCTSHHQCTSLHVGRQQRGSYNSFSDRKFSQYTSNHQRKLRQCTSRFQHMSNDDGLPNNKKDPCPYHHKCTSHHPYKRLSVSLSPSRHLRTTQNNSRPGTPFLMPQNPYYSEDNGDLSSSDHFTQKPFTLIVPSFLGTPSVPFETKSLPPKSRRSSFNYSYMKPAKKYNTTKEMEKTVNEPTSNFKVMVPSSLNKPSVPFETISLPPKSRKSSLKPTSKKPVKDYNKTKNIEKSINESLDNLTMVVPSVSNMLPIQLEMNSLPSKHRKHSMPFETISLPPKSRKSSLKPSFKKRVKDCNKTKEIEKSINEPLNNLSMVLPSVPIQLDTHSLPSKHRKSSLKSSKKEFQDNKKTIEIEKNINNHQNDFKSVVPTVCDMPLVLLENKCSCSKHQKTSLKMSKKAIQEINKTKQLDKIINEPQNKFTLETPGLDTPSMPYKTNSLSSKHRKSSLKMSKKAIQDINKTEELDKIINEPQNKFTLETSGLDTPSMAFETNSLSSKHRKFTLKPSSRKAFQEYDKTKEIYGTTTKTKAYTSNSITKSNEVLICNANENPEDHKYLNKNTKKSSNIAQKIHNEKTSKENSVCNKIISNNTYMSSRTSKEELHREIEPSLSEVSSKKRSTIFAKTRKLFRIKTTDKKPLLSKNTNKNKEGHTNRDRKKFNHLLLNWKSFKENLEEHNKLHNLTSK